MDSQKRNTSGVPLLASLRNQKGNCVGNLPDMVLIRPQDEKIVGLARQGNRPWISYDQCGLPPHFRRLIGIGEDKAGFLSLDTGPYDRWLGAIRH
jgi:hypothetical protein